MQLILLSRLTLKKIKFTKLQKLCSLPRNLRVDNELPMLFLKKPLCMDHLLPACKILAGLEKPIQELLFCEVFNIFPVISQIKLPRICFCQFVQHLLGEDYQDISTTIIK